MSKQKLTPWFVNGEKPWEWGVYGVRDDFEDEGLFAYFGESGWGPGESTPEDAFKERENGARADYFHTEYGAAWRGLAHPPKAKP